MRTVERHFVPGIVLIIGLCSVGAMTLIGAGVWEIFRLAKWMVG
jgi:hypothetical protein